MDYIFLSSILAVTLLSIFISYDICCQWKINFKERLTHAPDHLTTPHIDEDTASTTLPSRLQYGLPVWHAGAHDRACQTANSLRYKTGVGATDGEGVERNWSSVNPMAASTKEMGEGNRHDELDDQFGFNNFQKNINLGAFVICFFCHLILTKVQLGDSLMRKLLIAIEERQRQVNAFIGVRDTVDRDAAKGYIAQVEAWEQDPSLPNPYLVPRTGWFLLLITTFMY